MGCVLDMQGAPQLGQELLDASLRPHRPARRGEARPAEARRASLRCRPRGSRLPACISSFAAQLEWISHRIPLPQQS